MRIQSLWQPLRLSHAVLLCAVLAHTVAYPQTVPTAGVRGYWREPSGSILRILPCGPALCVEIAALSAGSHPKTDTHNPDPRLRNRPLCGLRIGADFSQSDPQHARGGRLYDPKSGRTYRGQMTAAGNLLELRGYVGLPLFGRTETWMRTLKPAPCPASARRHAEPLGALNQAAASRATCPQKDRIGREAGNDHE